MSMNDLVIRLSTASDRDAILRFIAEMGFNPRDAITWDGLHMLAMTAWQGERLIGAIPFEPRLIQAGNGRHLSSIHETVVAVHPDFRAAGIGSRLQQAIFNSPPGGATVATVFREEPESAAYRWYLRNGFSPAMRIDSWFCDTQNHDAKACDDIVVEVSDQRIDWPVMNAIWERNHGASDGLVNRRSRPLRQWLAVHPYKSRYAFRFAVKYVGKSIAAYALLGIGTLHSQTTRVDILEFCAPLQCEIEEELLRSIITFSARNGYRPVRWPLAEFDPHAELASAAGFRKRWSFDMLIRPLSRGDKVRDGSPAGEGGVDNNSLRVRDYKSWRYAGVDYA